MKKVDLRRKLIKIRQSLPVEEWREKSDRLCSHLHSLPLFTQARTVLAYFSFRQEPDLSPLLTDTEKLWGFPRCVGKSLCWHSWKTGEPLCKGLYGILEPDPEAPLLQLKEVDLILVPAVACDQRGHRLGYGGGFYDRMLSLSECASKPTIGIVFEFAYLFKLPIDQWDNSLHSVCTDTAYHQFS